MTNPNYAPTAWGKTPAAMDLECPSGQLCQVRPPGVESLITAGVLENVDTLTSMVDEKHLKRVTGKNKSSKPKNTFTNAEGQLMQLDTDSLMKDPGNLVRVFTLVDKVVEHMVLQPKVKRPIDSKGNEITEREEGVVYTDQIEMGDKMYIFQHSVGGSADLESFRQQFRASMDGVEAK